MNKKIKIPIKRDVLEEIAITGSCFLLATFFIVLDKPWQGSNNLYFLFFGIITLVGLPFFYLDDIEYKYEFRDPPSKARFTIPFSRVTFEMALQFAIAICYLISIISTNAPWCFHVGLAILGICIFTLKAYIENDNSIRFKSDYVLLDDRSEEEKAAAKVQQEHKEKDKGDFVYDKDHFTLEIDRRGLLALFGIERKVTHTIKWDDIDAIMVYKTDSYAYDTIWVAIFPTEGEVIQFNEDTPGFTYFTQTAIYTHLTEAAPFHSWFLNVMAPAFEPTPTMIYQKGENLNTEGCEPQAA